MRKFFKKLRDKSDGKSPSSSKGKHSSQGKGASQSIQQGSSARENDQNLQLCQPHQVDMSVSDERLQRRQNDKTFQKAMLANFPRSGISYSVCGPEIPYDRVLCESFDDSSPKVPNAVYNSDKTYRMYRISYHEQLDRPEEAQTALAELGDPSERVMSVSQFASVEGREDGFSAPAGGGVPPDGVPTPRMELWQD